MVDEAEPDLRQPIPRDAVHDLILGRLDVLEKEHKEFERWQFKKDVMLDSFAQRLSEHNERLGSVEDHIQEALKEQTKTIMEEFARMKATSTSEFITLKSNIESVVQKQTFWENVIKVLRWIGAAIAGAAFVIWTVGVFWWDHWHSTTTPK